MPTSLIIGAAVAGLGLSAAGAYTSAQSAKKQNEAQQQMIAEQQQQEAIRKQAMELDAQRKQTENIRQVQRQRALGLATATNQGAQYGSGLQGGFGQILGQGNWNALGIQQNLGFGEQTFDSNARLSQDKMQYADAQTMGAYGAGMSSLGGAFISTASTLGNIAGQFKGFGGPNANYGAVGGGYYGTGGAIYPGPGRYQ